MKDGNLAMDIVSFDGYPDLLNVSQIQQILGLGRSAVYSLIQTDEIKHMKIRGKIRIPRRYIVEYINTIWYNYDNTIDAGKSNVSKEAL